MKNWEQIKRDTLDAAMGVAVRACEQMAFFPDVIQTQIEPDGMDVVIELFYGLVRMRIVYDCAVLEFDDIAQMLANDIRRHYSEFAKVPMWAL